MSYIFPYQQRPEHCKCMLCQQHMQQLEVERVQRVLAYFQANVFPKQPVRRLKAVRT